jgi:Uma2 family endonuclease
MPVEDFEELASRAPETVRLEFIGGRLEVKRVPDGNHSTIIAWLARRCMQARPELDLYWGRGLRAEEHLKGRALPDAVLVPTEHFVGAGEWADPAGVLMAVEISFHDDDPDRCCRCEKAARYASAEIPAYLLIDRDTSTITVHSGPEHGRYRDTHTVPFGESISLPEPVDITLETEILKRFVR